MYLSIDTFYYLIAQNQYTSHIAIHLALHLAHLRQYKHEETKNEVQIVIEQCIYMRHE